MTNHDEVAAVRPLTLAWVSQHLKAGERIVRTEALHGDITADMRRLTIGTRGGGTRHLVLRSFVDPFSVGHAEDWLKREAGALTLLAGTGVPAPGLVAVDPTAAQCAYPSLLMTHLGAGQSSTMRDWRRAFFWGLRFPEAYEEAGGVLAAAAGERLYWRVRDGLACSEEVRQVAQPWRKAGRAELTTRAVEERLDAYVTAVMDALG